MDAMVFNKLSILTSKANDVMIKYIPLSQGSKWIFCKKDFTYDLAIKVC